MRFTLGGKRHELDFDRVVAAASRAAPQDIDGRHKYYVVIGGRRFPVKQLFAEATGLRRAEFITDDAFRIFRKLGFDIEEFARPPHDVPAVSTAEKPATSKLQSHKFAVSLAADEDGYIVASCPQLPGCHSQGRNRQEAIGNVEEAIRGYIASMKRHGEAIPNVDCELIEVKS